jgi:hypothetical protein
VPRPYANDPERLDRAAGPDLVKVLLIAFGIALLLGLTSGLIWVAYNLVRVHLLP